MNDPGCTMMKCTDYKNGVCHFNGDHCKYNMPEEIDENTIADADRFRWLINHGLAWRGCYDLYWLEGEWLYHWQDARGIIDAFIEKEREKKKKRQTQTAKTDF